MTNVELVHFAKLLNIPYFRGVFMRNALPHKIRKSESGFVNLDDKEGDGTHWTSYVKRGNIIRYFDSIGRLKPSLELMRYFRSDGNNNIVLYNYDKFQTFNSYNCGQLSLKFLYNNS